MPNRADEILDETEKLSQAAKDAIWKKLEAERGNRDPFTFQDPRDAVLALALLRPKVLESPDSWSGDDWKFVFFYGFQGCLEQKDASWVFARVLADLPKLNDGGKSFLEEIEKA